MSHARVPALLTLALLAAAMVFGGFRQNDAPGLPPLVQWCGPESKRPDAGFVLVRDAAAWEALWAAHTGEKLGAGESMFRNVCPKIDFTRCCIVARFTGKTVNCDGEVAETVRDGADHVVIRFQTSTFQTFGNDARGGAVDVSPFGIWVIPATDKPIAVEQATRENHLKADPITWKEVHRFPARVAHIPPPGAGR